MSSILVGTDAKIHVGWFGLDDSTSGFPGTTPDGIGTFQLSLENGYTVTLRWPTDVIKTRSGQEQRISRNDRGKEFYAGSAVLLGDQAVSVRATLARSAAQGAPILLGMQHEEIQLDADASGMTVYADTSLCDWINPGQRVFLVNEDSDDVLQSVEAVIQGSSPTSLDLDVDPGTLGLRGCRVMPAMPVLLEPQQDFARYPRDAEVWKINGRAARFDFAQALNYLNLGPSTLAAGLEGARITAKSNALSILFGLIEDTEIAPAQGVLIEAIYTEIGEAVLDFVYQPGVTTIGDMIAAFASSTLAVLSGATGPTETLELGDEFSDTLTGGLAQGPVGTGAAITTYASHPVWDYELSIEETITDSIQAMTEIIDHGGVPYAIGSADFADWGRAVMLASKQRADWQWLKLFLATTKGPQKAFWLPTWRDDLPFVSKATGTITVEGDVSAWWPAQRQHVQILETSGTVTRAEVTAATDNGDGTWTLTIGTTLATSSVDMVSWLELCRFEKDEFQVTFDQHGFSMATVARVVQR